MTYTNDHEKKTFHGENNANADQKNSAEIQEEISLDSPCKEGCNHPEHQKQAEPKSEEESFKDKWLRAVAEGENLRRRLEKEKKEAIEYALFRFAREMVGIANLLNRAVDCVPESEHQSNSLYQGVSMTLVEMERALARFSVLKIDSPLHQAFNPHYHEVMQEQENNAHAPGTILQVLQNGYTLHDRLVSPVMVAVAKAKIE